MPTVREAIEHLMNMDLDEIIVHNYWSIDEIETDDMLEDGSNPEVWNNFVKEYADKDELDSETDNLRDWYYELLTLGELNPPNVDPVKDLKEIANHVLEHHVLKVGEGCVGLAESEKDAKVKKFAALYGGGVGAGKTAMLGSTIKASDE